MKEFDSEIVSGSVLKSVWKLAWPSVLLSLINGSSGFVDHVLVGHFVNSNANAAMGIAQQAFLVVIVFVSSLFNGMAVLVARYAGMRRREDVADVVYHTFLAALMFQIFIVAPLGYISAPLLLDLANAEEQVQVHALPFLRIMFTCSTTVFMQFMLTGALQASGNPKTPLVLGILSTIINIVLSSALITGFGPFPTLGAPGAALGTVISPIPSILIALYLIASGKLIIGLPKRLTLLPDPKIVWEAARIGIPTGIQAVLLNIGGFMLLHYIGALPDSAEAQAAYTICYSQLFSFISWTAFGLRSASSAIMGQNIGAGNIERGKHGVYVTTMIGFLWACGFGLLFFFLPAPLLAIFRVTTEPTLGFGVDFLRYLAFSGLFLATALALTGGLQGAGDTKSPMWIALITQIGVLLGTCEVLYRLGMINTHVIWIAILVSHTSRMLLTAIVFQRGKWRNIKVQLRA